MNTNPMTVGQLDAAIRTGDPDESLWLASRYDGEGGNLVEITNILRSYTGVMALPVASLRYIGTCFVAEIDFPLVALVALEQEG